VALPAEQAPAREGLPGADCPYRGLVPFAEEDTAYFFGRGAEREIIAANLIASRLTLFYAPSGVGKSSVLLAGVLHDLREAALDGVAAGRGPEYIPVAVREWHEAPLATLRAAIRDALTAVLGDDAPTPDEDGDLVAALAECAERSDATLVLILDQFEEFLLYHGHGLDPGDALPQLARVLADDALPVNALLALREDALAGLDRFKGRVPGLFDNYLRLRHLDEVAGRQAIEGPVARWNADRPGEEPIEVEPELVETVLRQVSAGRVPLPGGGAQARDAGEHTGIEAPFLQLVMTRVWRKERAEGSSRLRAETLAGLGGANSIVAAYLSEQMERLSDAERDVASAVFHQLVTPSGAKVARSLGDLADYTGVDRDVLLGVLDQLSQGDDWRILRSAADPQGGADPSFEIFHDVLADPALAWRAEHEQHRAARDAVVREKERARRRRRRVLGGLGLAALAVIVGVTVALTVAALHQRDKAEKARAEAFTQELAASSLAQRDSDPELAVMLALRAVGRERNDETIGALRAAVAADPLRAAFRTHDGTVNDLGTSPDGSEVVAAYQHRTARIWRLGDRRPGPVLHVGAPVNTARFSADGKLVATASPGGLAVWDARTGRRLHTLGAGATGLRWAARGDRLVAVLRHRAVLYDAGSGRLLRTFPGRGVAQATWGYGGRPLVARRRSVQLWDPTGRRMIHQLRGAWVGRVIADESGRRASVVLGGRLRLWDLRTGRAVTAPIGRVLDAAISRNGERVVTAGKKDGHIVDAVTGKPEAVLPGAHANEVRMSADGSTAATIAEGGSAIIWDARTGRQLEKLSGRLIAAPSLTFTPAPDVVTGGMDGTVRVWRAGAAATTVRLHDTWGSRPAFDPSGRRLVTGGGFLWNLRNPRHYKVSYGFYAAWTVDFSPRGDRIVVTGDRRRATLYAVDRPKEIAALGPPGRGPTANNARYSPDGKLIATAESDGTVRLWSADTLRPVRALGRRLRHAAIYDVAFSSDGRLVAAGGRRGNLRVYAVASGRQLHFFHVADPSDQDAWINAVAVQPHGDLVAAGSSDGVAHVLNVRTGLRQDLPSDDGVNSVAFSPNGRLLLTGSDDGTARLWDAATARQLAVLMNADHGIYGAVFSRDGRQIAIAPDSERVSVVACSVCGTTRELIRTARRVVTRRFTPGERATLLRSP
jgi:WD40 repeat protein